MSGGLTNYATTALLAGTALPQTLYIKLHLGDPGADAVTNVAVETTRAAVDLEPGVVDYTATNATDGDWTGLAADETATHFSLWDAATAGNPWMVGPFNPSATLSAGGNATIPAGNITITLTPYTP